MQHLSNILQVSTLKMEFETGRSKRSKLYLVFFFLAKTLPCFWVKYLETGFGEKPELDEGIYQILLFGDLLKGNCKFPRAIFSWNLGSQIWTSKSRDFTFAWVLDSLIIRPPSTFGNFTIFELSNLSFSFLFFHSAFIPYRTLFSFLRFYPGCLGVLFC